MTQSRQPFIDQPKVELVVDAHAVIGESPVWAAEQNALYWLDIRAPALFRTDAGTAETRRWDLPAEAGCMVLTRDARAAILGLRTGVFRLDLETGNLDRLAAPPFDPRTHRFNEGACDARGRFWLGVMFEPQPGVDAQRDAGRLHSYTEKDGLIAHDATAMTPNGFAWDLAQQTFFFADSRTGEIAAYAFDREAGRLGERRLFANVPRDVGVPDGGAFDREGCYWCAVHRGGRLQRYTPDGTLEREVMLPVKNPTKPAFGGDDLQDIYVTSATHGKPETPHEGGLFRLRAPAPGLPMHRFDA